MCQCIGFKSFKPSTGPEIVLNNLNGLNFLNVRDLARLDALQSSRVMSGLSDKCLRALRSDL